MGSPVDVRLLSPLFCHGTALTSCTLNLAELVPGDEVRVQYWLPGAAAALRRAFMRTPVPTLAMRAMYKARLEPLLIQKLERDFRAAMVEGSTAWLWPGVSDGTFEWLAERGHPIVLERVNSAQASAKATLDRAFAELGLVPDHTITAHSISVERRKLSMAHHVWSPSPAARESFLAEGVPAEKIWDTSYGWDPNTFRAAPERRYDREPATFLFAGSGDVRKGLPWLLRAWERAEPAGRLVVVGRLDPQVRDAYRQQLEREDVVVVPHTADLVPMYDSADVFVLPSLEEGSPLVGYMALAAGLPCLMAPAAASGVVRHDVEGFVHETRDEDAWVASLRTLARDPATRARLGRAARHRSLEFTWERVAERRRAQLATLTRPSPAAELVP